MCTRVILILICSLAGCSRVNAPISLSKQTSDSSSVNTVNTEPNQSLSNADRKAIFDAIIVHVLNDSTLSHTREFYGTKGDRNFALVSNGMYGIPWPDWYTPSVENFDSTRFDEGSSVDHSRPRLLGIRLDKFDLQDNRKDEISHLFEGQIHITLLNAGGNGGDVTHIGGCSVYYNAKRDGDKWRVEFVGALDA